MVASSDPVAPLCGATEPRLDAHDCCLLTNDTIGKIAAGEVVERPVSVVKELLENALDAGATRIPIAVRGGGIELIEVADDGCGIAPRSCRWRSQRHATSKLTTFEDLDRLTTLGFRGEALPSIGAVSSLTIRSRTSTPRRLAPARHVRRGRRAGHGGAGQGTTVTVRDLFANVPARRKFLRQPATESGYIARAVAAYAATYPAVAFELIVDGRRAFVTDGSGDAIAAADGRLGASRARGDPAGTARRVGGGAGGDRRRLDHRSELSRSHRQGLVFFVNGRWIQNRALAFALEEAYHRLLIVGRHPLAAVHIRLDPAAVDVNVHPTKAEVKFLDERAVCRAVQRAAHAALARAPTTICDVMISSSALVRATKSSTPRLTVSGDPTAEQASAVFEHRSLGGRHAVSEAGDRRRQLRGLTAAQVQERLLNRREEGTRLFVAVGGDHVETEHHARAIELFGDGVNSRRDKAIASISCAGAKWDANAYGRPSAAARDAPNRLDPRIHTGTRSPSPGTARTADAASG